MRQLAGRTGLQPDDAVPLFQGQGRHPGGRAHGGVRPLRRRAGSRRRQRRRAARAGTRGGWLTSPSPLPSPTPTGSCST
ncbi:hypothetical protein ACU4GD_13730 [Cupriavidus basilensis]